MRIGDDDEGQVAECLKAMSKADWEYREGGVGGLEERGGGEGTTAVSVGWPRRPT